MKKSTPAQWVIRVVIYILGMFSLAFGVAISANSNLGISPVNSLPYVISDITPPAIGPIELNPGNCVTLVFCVYILLQILLLRKKFKWYNLTQIVFSFIFGYFVNLTKALVGDWAIPTYAGKLVMLVISILLIAVGVILYLDVSLVPMPMEGLSLALADIFKVKFPTMKMLVDCAVVLIGLILSFALLGGVTPFIEGTARIREGTVITALVTGPIMGVLRKPLSPVVKKLSFGRAD